MQNYMNLIIIPLLVAITGYIISYINKKKDILDNSKSNDNVKHYVDLIAETISTCVSSASATTVKALKENGTFTPEIGKQIFDSVKTDSINILGQTGIEILQNAFGDLDKFIEHKIESFVDANKK